MKKDQLNSMQNQFDALVQTHPDEPKVEFWFALDSQEPLGYARWENFLTAIRRAIDSCKSTGYDPDHHFRGVTKMITREHVQNNTSLRNMLGERGIQPEELPPAEDIKKLERRVKREEKKIEKDAGRLPEQRGSE